MLQTESNSDKNSPLNNIVPKTDKQADIVKRLGELNKWQEEQKQLLETRQTMQREMLGLEQQTIYQMLGLQNESEISELDKVAREIKEEDRIETIEQEVDSNLDDDLEEYEVSLESSQLELEEEDIEEQQRIGEPCSFKTLTSGYATEDYLEVNQQKPKKSFLKRGDGLKQRFKIDPDVFRLNNLPRYKYANAHPRLRLQLPGKPTKAKNLTTTQTNFSKPASRAVEAATLDAQEQRFQNLLISSQNTCSSTPDTKNSSALQQHANTISSNSSSAMPKVRFLEPKSHIPPNENSAAVTPVVAWSKILDSQQLTPLDVPRDQLQSLPTSEESIFELLEQKAINGSFDMNSSCLKQFMERRLTEKLNETDDVIPVDEEVKTKRLEHLVSENIQDEPSSMDELEESQLTEDGESTESEETTHETIETTNCSYGPQKQIVRVRFSESNETHEYDKDNDTTVNDSTRLSAGAIVQEGQGDSTNNEFFDQFKQALFAALQIKSDQHLANDTILNSSDTTLTPKDSLTKNNSIISQASKDLQHKTDMIQHRLSELEKEINNFKENNVLLMKAKQEHELEKSLNAQEHLEAMDRVKDEKIHMEIYLHDERVKLEEEKRQFEQTMKMKTQGLVAKERKENERLREQLSKLEVELKAKDVNHSTAQARLRSQLRILERDQKKLHEQIEALIKDNKRLENENLRISREQNNKILQEINRNIAKLAPKQIQNSSTSMPEEGPPTMGRTISKCIVAAATANKNYRSPLKKYEKTRKLSNAKFPIAKPSKKGKSPQSSAEADTTPESSFTEEKEQSVQQKKQQYLFDDDDEDEDILQEFKKSPTRRNNIPQISKQHTINREDKSPKHHPQHNLIPTPPPPSPRTTNANNMKREIVNEDGSKDIWYPNGNLKKISADGMVIRMLYYNKDIKETNINEGTVKYYYSETNTWHTTYLDGLEILEFPNGQIEHRHKNGIVEVHYPNNSVKITNPTDELKQEEWRFADGTHLLQMRNGDKILSLPNGQKEIHNKLHKRREYPDGTVKIVYADGSTETRYSNGRVRLKDKDGKLVMDTDVAK